MSCMLQGLPLTTPHHVLVIMTVANQQDSVVAAIETVLQQTWRNLSLVVVDMGSLDNTTAHVAARCEAQPPAAPQMRLVLQPAGTPLAYLNELLQATRSPYVALTHGHCLWHPDKLQQQMHVLARTPRCAAVFAGVAPLLATAADTSPPLQRYNPPSEAAAQLAALVLQPDAVAFASGVLRQAALQRLGGFDSAWPAAYLYDCRLRLLQQGVLQVLPQRLCQVRLSHTYAAFAARQAVAHEAWQILGRQFPQLVQRYPELATQLEALYGSLCQHAYVAGDFSAATKYLQARQQKFRLTALDQLRLADALMHQLNFKAAQQVLLQVTPDATEGATDATYTAQAHALQQQLLACLQHLQQAGETREAATLAAARGMQRPLGTFVMHGLPAVDTQLQART
jgi:hypothetical protein